MITVDLRRDLDGAPGGPAQPIGIVELAGLPVPGMEIDAPGGGPRTFLVQRVVLLPNPGAGQPQAVIIVR